MNHYWHFSHCLASCLASVTALILLVVPVLRSVTPQAQAQTARVPQIAQPQSPKALSLADALRYALDHQATYRNALLESEISAERLKEAGNKFLPRISASLDVRANLIIARTPIPIGQFTDALTPPRTGTGGTNAGGTSAETASRPDFIFIPQGREFANTLGLDVQQPIYDAALGVESALARTNEELANTDAIQARIDLTIAVTRAYYTALLNQEKLRQAEANAARTANFYNDVQAKFQNAHALKTDVSRAYLNASNARQSLRQAQDAVRLSLIQLATQIGMNTAQAEQLTLSDKLTAALDTNLQAISEERAAEKRVEFKSELLRRESSLLQMQKASAQSLPKLSAYGYLGTQTFRENFGFDGQWFPLSYVGVNLSVPISEWFTKAPSVQQNALQASKSENTLANLRETIRYELEQTRSNLRNAAQNLTLQQENVKIAEELVATANNRYKQGQATNQDVLEAEFTLRDTQTAYLQAMYDYILAKVEWEKAKGSL